MSRKYPFDSLAVGQTATVSGVPTRGALQIAKHSFQQSCRALGYRPDELPNFALTYDPATQVATITRLRDGAVLKRGPAPVATSRASQRRAWRALVDQLDADIQAYMLQRHSAIQAGHVPPLPSERLFERCHELNVPGLATALALLTGEPSPTALAEQAIEHAARTADPASKTSVS